MADDTPRIFHVCDDHKRTDWNQPQIEDDHCILCRLFYLEAQESLLEEWQQRAMRAEEAIKEVERPLDAQMARLNSTVVDLNEKLSSMTAERDALRSDAERYRILRRFDLVSLHHATQTFEGISNLDAFCDAAMSEEGG